jgi:hypothetical protein
VLKILHRLQNADIILEFGKAGDDAEIWGTLPRNVHDCFVLQPNACSSLFSSAQMLNNCNICSYNFWVVTQRRFSLVRDERFGTAYSSHLQGPVGNNPKVITTNCNSSRSLKSHKCNICFTVFAHLKLTCSTNRTQLQVESIY